jgi:hypothetical protein
MQVKITRTHKTEEIVELALPYYFEHDCGGDDYEAMYYGKIEATRTTKIRLGGRRDQKTAEIEVEACVPASMSSYLTDEYKSTEAAYMKAKRHALELLNGA